MFELVWQPALDALAHAALLTFPFWLGYLARALRHPLTAGQRRRIAARRRVTRRRRGRVFTF